MGAPAANGNDNDALFDASPLERHRRVSSILDPHAASGARGARSLAVQRAVETFVLCAQAATPLLQVEHAEERAWFRSKENTGKDMPTTTADLTDGERVLCDGCEAGIFDLYFTCAKCESDFCPFCAAEARIDDAKDANDKGKGVDELPMTTAAAPRAMATARDIARSGAAARRLANAGGAAALGLGIPTALLGIFRGEQWPGETQNGSAASGALPMPAWSPPCPCCARDAKKTARRQLLSIQQRTAGTQRRQLYRLLGLPWPAPLPLATAPGPASCEISLPRLRRLHNPPGGTTLPGLLVVPGGVNDADADDNNKETMGSLCVPTVRSRGVGEPNGILVVKLVPPRGSSLQSSRRSSGGGGAGIHSIHTGFHTRERTSTDRPTTAVTHLHALRNCLADGSPVLVCGCLGASTAQWDPGFFQAYHRRLYKSSKVDVDDCDDGAVVTIATDDFWKGYTTGDTYFSKPSCYNLKDWPVDSTLAEMLPEQYEDLVQRVLPFLPYTSPSCTLKSTSRGADALSETWLPGSRNILAAGGTATSRGKELWGQDGGPDVGPKLHFSMGRGPTPPKLPMGLGASVEKLSVVEADICAIVMHATKSSSASKSKLSELPKPSHETSQRSHEPVCVWHIFTPHEAAPLNDWILPNRSSLVKSTQESWLTTGKLNDPLFDSAVYLQPRELERISQELGITPLIIYQNVGEAVIIPAGCVYQILNVRANTRAVIDFLGPESCLRAAEVMQRARKLPEDHWRREDRLLLNHLFRCSMYETAEMLEKHLQSPKSKAAESSPSPRLGGSKSGGSKSGGSKSGGSKSTAPSRKRARTAQKDEEEAEIEVVATAAGANAAATTMANEKGSLPKAMEVQDNDDREGASAGGDVEMCDAAAAAAAAAFAFAAAAEAAALPSIVDTPTANAATLTAAASIAPALEEEEEEEDDEEPDVAMEEPQDEEEQQQQAEDNNNVDNEEEEVDEDDEDDEARQLRLRKAAAAAIAELSDDDVTEDDDTGALPLPPPSPPLPPVESMDEPPEPPEMVLDTALDSPVDELNQLRDQLAVETADAIAASTAAHEAENAANVAMAAAATVIGLDPPSAAVDTAVTTRLKVDDITGAISHPSTGAWMGSMVEPVVPKNPFEIYANDVDTIIASSAQPYQSPPVWGATPSYAGGGRSVGGGRGHSGHAQARQRR